MDALQISKNVFWVGKVDDRKVPFHRLILERGTTYNSYFLTTEKPTIIDTVDMRYGKEYMDNLSKLVNPESIEYIVINHVEPDHAGALPALAARAKKAKIVTTELAAVILKDMFKLNNSEFVIIKDGTTIDIGGKTLRFFETPYLHTEETMITYDVEDKILFSCDVFSTHIATYELFNDLAESEYIEDFKVYYKLIMSPHRPYVRDMLEKIKLLDIETIAPSHGYILRKNAKQFIEIYDEMSKVQAGNKDKKVTIVYTTMTGNTTKLAQRLAKGLEELGIETQVINLKNADLDQVKKTITESDGVLVGSSTRYADMIDNIEEFLKSLEGENLKGKLAAAFGSYGWSGEAIIHLEESIDKAGFTIINERYFIKHTGVDTRIFPLRVKFSREDGLSLAEEAGRIFGEQILQQ
jgi:flavorubredoxin